VILWNAPLQGEKERRMKRERERERKENKTTTSICVDVRRSVWTCERMHDEKHRGGHLGSASRLAQNTRAQETRWWEIAENAA